MVATQSIMMNKIKVKSTISILSILSLIFTFIINIYTPQVAMAQYASCEDEVYLKKVFYSAFPQFDVCEERGRFGDYEQNESVQTESTYSDAGSGQYQNISYDPPPGVELSQALISSIDAHINTYKEVEANSGVPWQMLASMHYRENSFSMVNSGSCQGVLGFYTDASCDRFPANKKLSESDLKDQVQFMADILQNRYTNDTPSMKGTKLTGQSSNFEHIKDLAFTYNGRVSAYKSLNIGFMNSACPGKDFSNLPTYEFSSYVANKFDTCRAKMKLYSYDNSTSTNFDSNYGLATMFMLISKHYNIDVVGSNISLGGDIATIAAQGAQKIASTLLNSSNIIFNTSDQRCSMQQAAELGEYRGTKRYYTNEYGARQNRTCDNNGPDRVPATPGTLAVLLKLTEKYKINITSITTGEHARNSNHFSQGAIDIGSINGTVINDGSINKGIVKAFYVDLLNLLPSGAELGQQQCGIVSRNDYASRGIKAVSDPCNHIHFGGF